MGDMDLRPPMRTFAVLLCLALGACSNIERADPTVAPKRAERPPIPLDVDPIMRGTVASETVVVGYQPVIVRGYGFVVGLKGTGSRTAPAEVRQYILREMLRYGVGDQSEGLGGVQPEQLLNSEDTAIVIVEGVVPAGAPKGTAFDVRVYASPGTSTTSLEGGTLWTTGLRPGVLLVGSREVRSVAEAKGPIIVNPFADDSDRAQSLVNQLSGRILHGGKTLKSLPVKLVMATPSHSRSRLIASAINSNFPREPRQRGDTAQGRTGELITVDVPPSWHARSDEFVEMLRHTSINVGPIDATASEIARAVVNNPGGAQAASMRWQALGPKSLTSIRPLYDYPEEQPRFAALQAGARLDDPLVVPPLLDMAKSGSAELRVPAIRLLERMSINPSIDLGLRPLLEDSDIDIRLAAYEALRKRGDPIVSSSMVDEKFRLDVVPSQHPMVYVSQSGKPSITVFGSDQTLKAPMSLRTWDGNLLIKVDEGDDFATVFFRPGSGMEARVDKCSLKLHELIRFFGHTKTTDRPAPGAGMTYSQTIGAIYALSSEGAIPASFKVEQDRIIAAIAKAGQEAERTDRPEFIEDEEVTSDQPASAAAMVPGLTPTQGVPTGSGKPAKSDPKSGTVPR